MRHDTVFVTLFRIAVGQQLRGTVVAAQCRRNRHNILLFWRRSTASLLVFRIGACLESSLFPLSSLSPFLIGLLASVDVKQNYTRERPRRGSMTSALLSVAYNSSLSLSLSRHTSDSAEATAVSAPTMQMGMSQFNNFSHTDLSSKPPPPSHRRSNDLIDPIVIYM